MNKETNLKNWRWYLFWARDFFSGGRVRKAYCDIRNCYFEGNNDIEQDIENLLEHARTTTKFYSKYHTNNINEFKTINKMIIKDNYDKILSDKYKDKKLHEMSTSGSTGTPLTIKQDKIKRSRVIAEVLYFGQLCGYTFGERQLNCRVWVDSVKKSKFQKFLQNMITEDISNLDENKMKEIEKILQKDQKVKNILSYSSTLEKVAKYLLDNKHTPDNFNITSVISGSEILQDDTRKNLKKLFNCSIVSRYANEENGILAQECLKNQEFHLNNADYYFEFLKLDEDTPAEEGELSRIIVTDLYNYSMPMIRYDTGDLAIAGKSLCEGHAIVLKKLFGRRVDLIYNTKGDSMSPYIIVNNMWESKNIKQFKFIQKGKKEYSIILNVEENFNDEENIVRKFKNLLGQDAVISIEYTNEIPVLNSGKRKYIENLWKDEK